MSEWKEFSLSELCTDISYGYTESAVSEPIGPKFLRITDIVPKQIDWLNVPYCRSSQENIEKYRLEIGDIVIARTGATTGYNKTIKQLNYETVFASYLIRYRINKKIADPFYVGHILQSPLWQDYVNAIAGGSAQPGANAKQLGSFEFLLPPLPEQKAIAGVLSSLDNKIDLLHRQNKTLEAMAEALFRQWFVEEVDEKCEFNKLDEIAVVQNGYAFSSSNYIENIDDCLEVLKMGHIEKGGGLKTNPKRDYVPRNNKLSRWVLNKGDIVMAMTDMKDNVVILGAPAMIDKDDTYVLNQRVARIYLKSNTKLISQYFLYIQLKNPDFIADLQSKANSGVQVNLSTDAIKNSEIIIPPMKTQIEKGQLMMDSYLKKEKNDIQIRTLEKFRNTLLSKLMSGEVRVTV